MSEIDQKRLREFVLKHYNEQEKAALRNLIDMEETLFSVHLACGPLLSNLYEDFLDQVWEKVMSIQDGVDRRVLASVNDEIMNLLRKKKEVIK